jgi:hypothetical protein
MHVSTFYILYNNADAPRCASLLLFTNLIHAQKQDFQNPDIKEMNVDVEVTMYMWRYLSRQRILRRIG